MHTCPGCHRGVRLWCAQMPSAAGAAQVRTNQALREAVAIMEVEEGTSLELALQLPASWPLKPAHIDPRSKARPALPCPLPWLYAPAHQRLPPAPVVPQQRHRALPSAGAVAAASCVRSVYGAWPAAQVGVSESRLRHWLLSITARLQAQNGGLLPALALWRKNCAKEFAGELPALRGADPVHLVHVCVCDSTVQWSLWAARKHGGAQPVWLNARQCPAAGLAARCSCIQRVPDGRLRMCRAGGVPDLRVGAGAQQRPAAAAGLPHLRQALPPHLPVQVVQEQRQELLPPLPEQLELSWQGFRTAEALHSSQAAASLHPPFQSLAAWSA